MFSLAEASREQVCNLMSLSSDLLQDSSNKTDRIFYNNIVAIPCVLNFVTIV